MMLEGVPTPMRYRGLSSGAWGRTTSRMRYMTSVASPTARLSRAYLRHLFKAEEMLAMRLAVMHNLWFYNTLMERIRDAVVA